MNDVDSLRIRPWPFLFSVFPLLSYVERPMKSDPSCKVVVVMPAYNAAATLERTLNDIPEGSVDEIILVDDCSKDNTVELATKLGLTVVRHEKNLGYGGNQKPVIAWRSMQEPTWW